MKDVRRSSARQAVCLTLSIIVVGAARPAMLVAQDPSPYAGQETREIKSLSPEDVRQLLEGEGMGLAKAAELNGVPGPRHVLELAEELALDDRQLQETRTIFDRMRESAVDLGRRLVDLERELDQGFAVGGLSASDVERLTGGIGALSGELRAVHLSAHLEMLTVLTAHQVRRYGSLRGYDGDAVPHDHQMDGVTRSE